MAEPDSFSNLFKFYMRALTAVLVITFIMFLTTCAGAFGNRLEQNTKDIRKLEIRVNNIEKSHK